MILVKLALVMATLIAVGGGYVQEKRRLATLGRLPAAEARAACEAAEARRERVMIVVTAVLAAGAIAALALHGLS